MFECHSIEIHLWMSVCVCVCVYWNNRLLELMVTTMILDLAFHFNINFCPPPFIHWSLRTDAIHGSYADLDFSDHQSEKKIQLSQTIISSYVSTRCSSTVINRYNNYHRTNTECVCSNWTIIRWDFFFSRMNSMYLVLTITTRKKVLEIICSLQIWIFLTTI